MKRKQDERDVTEVKREEEHECITLTNDLNSIETVTALAVALMYATPICL